MSATGPMLDCSVLPPYGAATARVGLVAARSKDEARELAVELARRRSAAGAEVVREVQLGAGALA